jgi:hypothetical protein
VDKYERCADSILDGFPTDDLGSCHLPKGHAGMHMPLPILWQLIGEIDGPWNPNSDASRRLREVLADHPEFAAEIVERQRA